jgi:hypothetical protein
MDTVFARAVLLQQQIAEALFEAVGFAKHRELLEVFLQLGSLPGFEVVAMAAHQ